MEADNPENVVRLEPIPVQDPVEMAPRYSPPASREHVGKVNCTSIYEEDLVDLDEEDPKVTQVLEAPANMLAAFFDESGYWTEKVDYLVLIDDAARFDAMVPDSAVGLLSGGESELNKLGRIQ